MNVILHSFQAHTAGSGVRGWNLPAICKCLPLICSTKLKFMHLFLRFSRKISKRAYSSSDYVAKPVYSDETEKVGKERKPDFDHGAGLAVYLRGSRQPDPSSGPRLLLALGTGINPSLS